MACAESAKSSMADGTAVVFCSATAHDEARAAYINIKGHECCTVGVACCSLSVQMQDIRRFDISP